MEINLKSNMKIFSLFNETIKDYYSLYEPGLIRIARTDGKVLLEPDKQPLSTRIEEGLLSDIGKDMESKIYRDENDGEMLFSASPIKSTIRSTDIGFGGSHESIDHIRGNAGDNWMVILTTPAAIIDQKVLKLIKEFLLIGFLCIGFIAIFTLFFVRKITRNIIKLVDFTKEVDWRNLDRRIEVRTDDEIGALANSFNDMIVRLNRMMVSRMELMEEIDRRIEAEKKLQRLSATDELTQLYNRRAFNSYGDRVINYSKRHDEMLSIVMIDIDYFKRVNDKYGHNVGDMVLIRLADILSQNVRENDILYRWGGEEFIILMPDTEVEEAHKIAERLRRIVAETRFTQDIHITISIGVTQLGDMDIFDKLIERVDKALYKAKESGRNNVQAL